SARSAIGLGIATPISGAGGNRRACTGFEVTTVSESGAVVSQIQSVQNIAGDLRGRIENFARGPKTFAGLALARPLIMGIVNVTPDSFSDGGEHDTTESAIAHGHTLLEHGAVILDVGGESTRPGAQPVDPETEMNRIIPVIRALSESGAVVSADTRHVATMDEAIKVGAKIINDVTGLRDPAARTLIAKTGLSVIIMHMKGEPRTMQTDPRYVWAPGDIFDVLAKNVEECAAAGIARERIAIDPGIGFGQNDLHIAQVLDHIGMLHEIGHTVVLGASRKAFVGRWSTGEQPKGRVAGSIAAALCGNLNGVQILRVHDVAETRQALAVAGRIADSGDQNSG
ncbi:MAG: dihydropteroate synthase, partial [Rhodobacteraceae bacterium]|nr:dihydropteroate synthase [Paracoccaceae bacterium]